MIDSDQALVSGKKNIPRWPDIMNPGRFAPITCSPRKVSRFSPLNRYYIIIDEVFFDNFLVIIYLLVVCKKTIIHSFWSTFVKDLKRNFSCKINKKPQKNSKKVVFFWYKLKSA